MVFLLPRAEWGRILRAKLSPHQAEEENSVNAKLALALVVVPAVVLSGCAQGVVPAARTAAPAPTAVPTQAAFPTAVPTPTAVPAPTATAVPSVWDIAQTLVSECQGATNATGEMPIAGSYGESLIGAAIATVPQLADYDRWKIASMRMILPNSEGYIGPFADVNRPGWNYWWKDALYCNGYILAYQNSTMNTDGSGNLTGEAYLFYVTSGGQFKEVHFSFPPAS